MDRKETIKNMIINHINNKGDEAKVDFHNLFADSARISMGMGQAPAAIETAPEGEEVEITDAADAPVETEEAPLETA